MRPRISVLITYFNEGDLLRECLESVLAQRDPVDEILIYDDASTEPAVRHVPPKAPVQILRGEHNQGPAHGRNVLLRSSTSEYIHFHDADDLFDADWSRRVREVLDVDRPNVVFTEIQSCRGDNILCKRVLDLHRLTEGENLVSFCLRGVMLVPAGTYERELIRELGGYRTSLWQSEDFDFHARLAARNVSFSVLPDPLVTIRIRPDSRSQNHTEVWTAKLKALRMLRKDLSPKYRLDLAETAARIGSRLFQMGIYPHARIAFRLAEELNPSVTGGRHFLHRIAATVVGLERAEWFAEIYRRLFPKKMRECLLHLGRSPS